MGAWTEIVDYTVPSNTQSVVLNDFGTITKDDFIKIVFNIEHNAGNFVYLTANSTSSNTDYHRQLLEGDGGGTGAARANSPEFSITSLDPADNDNVVFAYLKLSENNRFNVFTNQFVRLDSSLRTRFGYITSTVDVGSTITSLTFTGDAANGIGAGTRIQIYRLDAEKVADITVASNSTQVDIPFPSGTFDPAINKDSEYLLVSDIKAGAAGGFLGNLNLTVNDATTLTNYNSQRIQGSGSTASAARENSARYLQVETSGTLAYTHIKLSEIGAYTAQSYTIFSKGTSELILANHFLSSTSEAITSITKLNVVATVSNIIPTGSTFVLYKLK
jgi:hypothetical protein